MIVLLAVLAVTATAFSSKMPFMKSTRSYVTSYSGRLALQMGSHGIYDVKSDNGVHSISFEVSNISRGSIVVFSCKLLFVLSKVLSEKDVAHW